MKINSSSISFALLLLPNNQPRPGTSFKKGIPVAIDDVEMPGYQIVSTLNDIGGRHGIGRFDIIENRVVGIKSREVYEAPAAQILHEAHTQLEKLTLDKDTWRYKQNASNTYANMIYDGLWFSPLFDSLTAFFPPSYSYCLAAGSTS